MRLGANYNVPFESEEQYDEIIRDLGAEALTCPLLPDTSPSDVARYKAWLTSTGLPLAEVGVWVNVLDGDEAKRHANIVLCQKALAMAEELGSRCCVNIAGSRGDVWDGYDVRNFTPRDARHGRAECPERSLTLSSRHAPATRLSRCRGCFPAAPRNICS